MVIDADGDGCGWTQMLMLVIITLSEKKTYLMNGASVWVVVVAVDVQWW